MCKKSTEGTKVLKDRTKGLDARGNVGVNTQAESRWAVQTLSGLDQGSAKLLGQDLDEIHKATKDDVLFGKKFHKGYVKFFGDDKNPQEPDPKDMVKLLLEGEYNFKGACDAMNRDQKNQKELYNKCRELPQFKDRGRKEGPKRRNSFSNPHAGITDHVFRDKETEDFFDKNVTHAKGMLEGVPGSKTYDTFVEQGMPFIGGVSGTMQALVMRWEMKEPLEKIKDPGEKKKAKDEREKLVGIHMATLLAGGHHSAGEMLVSAKSYGYFEDVANPLENYPKAMKELGERFQDFGLPGDMTPNLRKVWDGARQQAEDGLNKLKSAIEKTYNNHPKKGEILKAFQDQLSKDLSKLGSDDLSNLLDKIAKEFDQEERKKLIEESRDLVGQSKKAAESALITELEDNPFFKLSIRDTLLSALNQLEGIK